MHTKSNRNVIMVTNHRKYSSNVKFYSQYRMIFRNNCNFLWQFFLSSQFLKVIHKILANVRNPFDVKSSSSELFLTLLFHIVLFQFNKNFFLSLWIVHRTLFFLSTNFSATRKCAHNKWQVLSAQEFYRIKLMSTKCTLLHFLSKRAREQEVKLLNKKWLMPSNINRNFLLIQFNCTQFGRFALTSFSRVADNLNWLAGIR